MTYRPFSSVLLLCALLVVCGESAAQNTASSDADLSGLTLSAGTLAPAFVRDSLAYTATVANSIDSLTVTPTSNHNGATITVNGTSVSSGNASRAISLSVGENTITIVVTAEDGTTTKTYTVTVERGVNTQNTASSDEDLSGLTLSTGTLVPAFARDSLAYTATVAHSIDSLTVTPTSNHNGATITVNGTSVSSGNASSAISLSVGENTITIVVTAEDGTTTKTYTVTVERGVNIPDANLRAAIEGALEKSSGAIITPSEMATLTSLDLKFNGLYLPIGDLTGLEHATSLTTLYLYNNRFSDISALSGLTSLTTLSLNVNGISDISALSGLTSLTTLFLNVNGISDISALSGLTSLTTLSLSGISDISALSSALSGLTSLTTLSLSGNGISDISALSGLTSLTTLNLDRNSISDNSALSGLTSLTTLNLDRNSISDISALSGLTSLTTLNLDRNSISDISALSGLTSLTTLNLSGNNISAISLSGLTSLTNLNLSGNNISAISLSGLTSLKELILNQNHISDISALSGLTSLTYLDLRFNRISDISALPLQDLTSLTSLEIHYNLLNYPSLATHIPALQSRGVNVYYIPRTLTSLVKISGDDQITSSTDRLSDPLIVEVRDQNDVAFAGVLVAFSVTAGGGSLSTTTDTTDANGRASTRLTLGTVGADTVVAAIDVSGIDKSVTFTTATGGTADLIGLTLSAGTLVPAFVYDSLSYTATVAHSIDSLTIMPTSNYDGATITVNGTSVSSGSASSAISLSVGENPITIVVTAEDGTTTKTYTVTVVRDVNIPDANLRAAIESALKKSSGAIITPSEMATLTRLDLFHFDDDPALRIGDLTGLEHATSLEYLGLSGNRISDISALSGLTSLTHLALAYNWRISDISALSGLTSLTFLSLSSRGISDISALSGLTSLTTLWLFSSGISDISDISALSGLTSLTRLWLYNNNISDISALSGLTSLTTLSLESNRISDISALSGLTSLKELDIDKNRISDISPLRGLTSLIRLYCQENNISDISALLGLTSLRRIELTGNPLNYLSRATYISDLGSRGVFVDYGYSSRTLASLVKISGDDQTGTAGSRLSDPFIVEVRDQNDVAFAGVPVTFSVTAGGGSLSTTTDTTDANGRASTRLTLGTAGANTVKAIIDVADIDKSVTFTVTAAQGTGPVTVVTEPGQVTGVTVAPGEGYLGVSWDAVNGATGYKVQWKSGDALYASDRQQVIDNGGKTSATIAGLTAGTEYTVRVIATLTNADDGQPSVGVTGTPSDRPPSPPPPDPPAPPDPTPDYLPSFKGSTVTAQRYRTGTAINITLPQATGGDEALTYALTPALPSGLTFDATTRELSGTPGEIMDETEYTLTATDTDGDATTLTFTLAVIADRLPAFGDGTRVAAQRYFIGGNVRMTLPEATGGDGTLVYILLPILPKGLRFDSATHTISGTPSKVMTETEYTLSAFDADGDFASLTFTLEVQQPTADFNGDGQVNFADFIAFIFKYGTRRGDAEYDARYDLDSDGEIGFSDGQILTDQFGTGG